MLRGNRGLGLLMNGTKENPALRKSDFNKGYVVLVPVRNGNDGLHMLRNRLNEVFFDITERFGRGELLFVDDGSTDKTWETILQMSREERRNAIPVRGIKLHRGGGQQTALIAGLTRCGNRSVITMDDDLSHPPKAVPDLLKALDGGCGAVYALPSKRPGRGIRRAASALHQLHMSLLTGSPKSIRVGSYRAISGELVNRLLDAPMPFPYLSAQILSLRPAPKVEMMPTPAWEYGDKGRFNLGVLMGLELSLAWYYGPIPRMIRRFLKHQRTAGDIAADLIAEETP